MPSAKQRDFAGSCAAMRRSRCRRAFAALLTHAAPASAVFPSGPARRRFGERGGDTVLHGMSRLHPCIETADQRAHALQTFSEQDLRSAARGLLIRTRAIENDVLVGRKIVGARNRIEIEHARARNMRARLMREARADVNHE